jgi:protein gp37
MAENTGIEWATHSFNPWLGCTKISDGCEHCYAERDMDHRFKKVQWGPHGDRVRTKPGNWAKPVTWNAKHAEYFAQHGERQRVFCASLGDVFDNQVDPAWRADLLDLIERTPNLDWLLLTKRIGNVAEMLPEGWLQRHQNVWLGISVVNQQEADRDIPKLLALPAHVRFLSMEPLLGAVNLRLSRAVREDDHQDMDGWVDRIHSAAGVGLHWVIVGGESGPGARPMLPAWVEDLRDQCALASVPFLFKQWGEWGTGYTRSDGTSVFRQFASFQQWVNKASTWVQGGICLDSSGNMLKNGGDFMRARDEGKFPVTIMHRVGTKLAGRALGGEEHNGYPDKYRSGRI